MKNKFIMSAAIAAAVSLTAAGTALAAGWVQQGNDWYYKDNSGDYVTDTWKQSQGGYYYLGEDGVMLRDSLVDTGDDLYYVDANGLRVTNTWKFLYDDSEGEEFWYYFQGSGKAKRDGVLTVDGKRYFFTDYHMDDGWVDGTDGNVYYYGGAGATAGWRYFDDTGDESMPEGWYYTTSSGKLVTGQEKSINGQYYAFNDVGLMLDGWVEFPESDGQTVCKYYRLGSGERVSGWIYHNGEDSYDATVYHPEGWYYLNNGRPYAHGYRTTEIASNLGIAKINGKYYCFDDKGLMQYGIVIGDDSTVYYFGAPEDGSMKTGKVYIEYDDKYGYEGQTMYFNTKGGTGRIGSDYTGVKNGYLYENGELVGAWSGAWEEVCVNGTYYVVNEDGKVKTSGTVKDWGDVKYRVVKREDGKGHKLVKVDD